jgi:5-methylcytosine-specific restriction endonuclease McrA
MERAKERHRKWYSVNKERVSAQNKGSEKRKAYNRKYHAENKDKINARNKEYRKSNEEKIKKYMLEYRNKTVTERRQYYLDNYERSIESSRKWRAENPAKVKANKQRRRTRVTEAGGSFTADEWIALVEKYDYKCVCCGSVKPLDADHVIPVSKGGTSNIENIQPLCRSCNSRKNNRTIDYR